MAKNTKRLNKNGWRYKMANEKLVKSTKNDKYLLKLMEKNKKEKYLQWIPMRHKKHQRRYTLYIVRES